MNKTIGIFDIFGALVFIAIIFILSNFYKNSKIKEQQEYKYFTYGILTKIIGAVALAIVYVFYYGGGDTQMYFNGGKVMINTLFSDHNTFFKLFLSERDNLPVSLQNLAFKITYSKSNEEWFMIKITAIINLFSFNRYLISSILISIFAFLGSWKLFKTIIYFFPNYHKAAFISVFLLPSVIFWSSGILKDTVTFASLGLFFYHFVKIFFKKNINIFSAIIIAISSFLIFRLKAYILIGLTPGLIIMLYIHFKENITNNIIKKIASPILFVMMISVGYFMAIKLMNDSSKYRLDTLQTRIEGFHTWHTTQGGSSYSLGKVEYTPLGILQKVPAALNVTFFRPYLWEARNITSLSGAIESTILMLLFLYLFIKYKIKWIAISFKDAFLALAITYSIVFGFAVGFTSYNFGALARYKVPVMPFFTFILLYFYFKDKIQKKNVINI